MTNWTNSIALALAAATLTLTAGCTEDGPGAVSAVPEPAPELGDPAIYAPDGWPFQIGDRMSNRERARVTHKFKVPGITWTTRGATSSLHLVGGRVYAPLFESDPWTKVGEYPYVYRGHFPVRLPESMRVQEPDMPPEFHGRIEYYTPEPIPDRRPVVLGGTYVPPKLTPEQLREAEACQSKRWPFDDEGRVRDEIPCPERVRPRPPNRLMWPDYPERRK